MLIVNSSWTEEPCDNIMLKYNTQNYFRQFTKTLSFFFSEIQNREMVMCNCVSPKQLSIYVKYEIVADQKLRFIA